MGVCGPGAWERRVGQRGILCRGEAFADASASGPGGWESSGGLAQYFTRSLARALWVLTFH